MSNTVGKTTTKNELVKKSGRGIGKMLVIALTAFIGGLFAANTVQPWTCQTFGLMGNHVGIICGDKFKHITTVEAEKFLMHYYSRAGGSTHTAAWTMLTDEKRSSTTSTEFKEELLPLSWAEVLQEPEKVVGKFNVFKISVRYYSAEGDPSNPTSGRIVVRSGNVGLNSTNGDILLNKEDLGVRLSDERVTYPRAQLPTPHVTYNNALVDDTNQALPLSQQTPGGSLSILCKLDEATVQRNTNGDNIDLWFRTPDGWIPASAMPKAQTAGVTICDPRYAE